VVALPAALVALAVLVELSGNELRRMRSFAAATPGWPPSFFVHRRARPRVLTAGPLAARKSWRQVQPVKHPSTFGFRSAEPMPLAPGQWAKYKIVDEEGHPSIATYKVVGEEAGAHWIEFEQETYYGETVTLMLSNLGNRRDPDTIEIHPLGALAAATGDRSGGHVCELLQAANHGVVRGHQPHQRYLGAPCGADVGHREIGGRRQALHHGARRLRLDRREQLNRHLTLLTGRVPEE
jgi:hypothetical protein